MYWLKCSRLLNFSVVLLALWFSSANAAQFSFQECLDSNFESTVSHPSWPFGLLQKTILIKKNQCVIEIEHNRLKFLSRKWLIDVCREPVHIKYGLGDIEVIKRENACGPSNEGDFCQSYAALNQILQDDGLIFANGKREQLTDEHGKIYCTYLLINSYLAQGQILGVQPEWKSAPATSITPSDAGTTTTPTATEPAPTAREKKLYDF